VFVLVWKKILVLKKHIGIGLEIKSLVLVFVFKKNIVYITMKIVVGPHLRTFFKYFTVL